MTDEKRPRRRGLSPLDRTRPIAVLPGLAERLWSKVDRTGGVDACWPFKGKGQSGGYGVLSTSKRPYRTIYTHRLAYRLATGVDPHGQAVCHRCDNPPCCNPAHLFLGTIADNVRDMIAKGRQGVNNGQPPLLRGEQHGSAKVTEAAVREIRRRAAAGESSSVLGRAFGLDSSSVRYIVRRENWKHVA